MRLKTVVCALAVVAGALVAAAAEGPSQARPDHLILGIGNLAEGVRTVHEQTGVRPAIGGKHPGRGTQNALVSLGDGLYVEIVAPAEAAAGADEAAQLASLRKLEGLTPIGWAVSVPDVDDARQRLTKAGFTLSDATPGSRKRPDGSTLAWTTFGIASPQIPGIPFFIRWGDGVTHPAADSPAGCRLERLVVHSPSSAEAARALTALGVDMPVAQAPKAALSFTLRCPKGTVTFVSAGETAAR